MLNGAGFKRVDRKVLAEWTKKVNRVVSEIQTTRNITDTNKLLMLLQSTWQDKLDLK